MLYLNIPTMSEGCLDILTIRMTELDYYQCINKLN